MSTDEASETADAGMPRGKRLPLNSRRLTAAHLKQIATAMELPVTGSTDQLRQLIEGKLQTEGHETTNILVVVEETSLVEMKLSLLAEAGVFLETTPLRRAGQDISAEIESLSEALEEVNRQNTELGDLLEQEKRRTAELTERLEELTTEHTTESTGELAGRITELEQALKAEKEKSKQLWCVSCQQVSEHDTVLASKDAEVEALKARNTELEASVSRSTASSIVTGTGTHVPVGSSIEPPGSGSAHRPVSAPKSDSPPILTAKPGRRGKAPPVDPYDGENSEIQFDDWLPALHRAAMWNEWTDEESLVQLAGHLRGRALQEWNLLDGDSKKTFDSAVLVLRDSMDRGSRWLAAQDFRHVFQAEGEPVADLVRRLERTFQMAYGRDRLSAETRGMLLHSQLQEGLCYDLMRSSAVSAAQTYKALVTAAKNEEKRNADLRRRRQYQRADPQRPSKPVEQPGRDRPQLQRQMPRGKVAPENRPGRKCWNCEGTDHLRSQCPHPKKESAGRYPPFTAKQVQSGGTSEDSPKGHDDPLDFLYSSDSGDESHVNLVRVEDKGSEPKCAKVEIQGVPAYGVVDSGADITIIGGELFKRVAATAKLRKKDFKKPDRIPHTYDRRPFQLHGRMDLEIVFDGKVITTPVYIKMDAQEPLLFEGVCRQLGLVSYHRAVERWRGGKSRCKKVQKPSDASAKVPLVRVRLVQSVRILPSQSAVVHVQLEKTRGVGGPLIVEPTRRFEDSNDLRFDHTLVEPGEDGYAQIVLTNPTGITLKLRPGTWVGRALGVEMVTQHSDDDAEDVVPNDAEELVAGNMQAAEGVLVNPEPGVAGVNNVDAESREHFRKEKLSETLADEGSNLPPEERERLHSFLLECHEAFSLEKSERGETDLVELQIDTEDVKACRVMAQELQFELIDGVLFYLDTKYPGRKRAVVPEQLREQIFKEYHSGPMSGHFSGPRLYSTLVRRWWWRGMYTDTMSYCKKCPQCIIVGGTGRINRPPLHPIPVQRAFQIMGVDIMDLPEIEMGNCHVVMFQDFLTKWPMVIPVPDQRAVRLAKLLAEEIVPAFGVPEALLSDSGANLLSHLMMDLCQMLGVRKLNTTSYHPQCDGMVERFNRTLKTMIRKHVDQFGKQWDQYLSGLLWAYRNTPHESTGEKPSFLLFGFDCRSPTEAALLPPDGIDPMNFSDYCQELMLSLSSARETAAKCIRQAQKKYKSQHDKKLVIVNYELGDWVFVKFPHEETGRNRKQSRPWRGPYRIISIDDPDVSVVKVYFSQDPSIQVHLSRVQSCPIDFPAGYYWYGSKRRGPGRPPKWVDSLLSGSIPLYQDGTEPESIPDRDCLELPQENDVQPNPEPAEKIVHPCRYPLWSRSGRAVGTWGVM